MKRIGLPTARALALMNVYCPEVFDEDWDVNEARCPLLGARGRLHSIVTAAGAASPEFDRDPASGLQMLRWASIEPVVERMCRMPPSN
jgi:hypothetical protein